MSEHLARRVTEVFMGCLFGEGEPTDGAVLVEGVTMKVGFHPARLNDARETIRGLAAEIVSERFMVKGGGGASFLELPEARDGSQWGEHRNCQEFVCLAVASGLASYCAPRPLWSIFPGGMPYVVFNLDAQKAGG